MTTRTTFYSDAIASLEVEALDERDGVALLAGRPALADTFDPDAAARIVAALGGHALSVDVSGALLSRATAPTMAAFAAELEDPSGPRVVALGEELRIVLPSGHESSILLTISRSIEQLDMDGLIVLTLASVLGPRPLQISIDLVLFDEVVQGRMATLGAEHRDTVKARADLARVELIRAVIHRGMDNPALAQLVTEWLVTSRWAETLRFNLEHPDLADGRAKDLLVGQPVRPEIMEVIV